MLGYATLQRHMLQRGEPPQRSDSPTYASKSFTIYDGSFTGAWNSSMSRIKRIPALSNLTLI